MIECGTQWFVETHSHVLIRQGGPVRLNINTSENHRHRLKESHPGAIAARKPAVPNAMRGVKWSLTASAPSAVSARTASAVSGRGSNWRY